jgi:hypothetical protein
VIHYQDGRNFSVAAREYFSISPKGRTVVVFGEGEACDFLDAGWITKLETP